MEINSFFKLQQFISKLPPTSQLSRIYAMQPLRFFCVKQNNISKKPQEDKTEDDKLYKSLEIELRGHDPMVMKSYVKFSRAAAKYLDIDLGDWYVYDFVLNQPQSTTSDKQF